MLLVVSWCLCKAMRGGMVLRPWCFHCTGFAILQTGMVHYEYMGVHQCAVICFSASPKSQMFLCLACIEVLNRCKVCHFSRSLSRLQECYWNGYRSKPVTVLFYCCSVALLSICFPSYVEGFVLRRWLLWEVRMRAMTMRLLV